MMRRLRPFAATALVVLVASCTNVTDDARQEPTTSSVGDESARSVDPTSAASPVTSRVDVEVGHCFVEPVVFDGEEWNVTFDRQFGWGGIDMLQPWEGVGVMTRIADDLARYEDDGGVVVEFRPVNHPSVRPVETAGCD